MILESKTLNEIPFLSMRRINVLGTPHRAQIFSPQTVRIPLVAVLVVEPHPQLQSELKIKSPWLSMRLTLSMTGLSLLSDDTMFSTPSPVLCSLLSLA